MAEALPLRIRWRQRRASLCAIGEADQLLGRPGVIAFAHHQEQRLKSSCEGDAMRRVVLVSNRAGC